MSDENNTSNKREDTAKLIKIASEVKKSNEETNKRADDLEAKMSQMYDMMKNLPKFKINAPSKDSGSDNGQVNPSVGNNQYVDDLVRKLGTQSQSVGGGPAITFDLAGLYASLSNQLIKLSEDVSALKVNQGYPRNELDLKIDLLTNTLKAYVDGLSNVVYKRDIIDNMIVELKNDLENKIQSYKSSIEANNQEIDSINIDRISSRLIKH